MKLNKLFIVLGLMLALFACKEDTIFDDREADGVAPGVVSIDAVTPLAGKLYFDWTLPDDADFMYVLVTYTKADSTERVLTYSKYNTEGITIPNLIAQEYEFSFVSVDESGSQSEAIFANGTPLTPSQITAAATVTVESRVGAIVFDWENPTGDSLLAVVNAITPYGDSTIMMEYTGSVTGLRVDIDDIKRDYQLIFVDPEQNYASSDTFTTAAYKEVQFDRTSFISEYSGYSSFMNVFDGDWTVHFAAGGPFPKTIPFRSEEPIIVSKINMYVSRKNDGQIKHQVKQVEVLTSLIDEAEEYVSQGVFDLLEVDENQENWYDARALVLKNEPECQYIKLLVKSTYSGNNVVIGEIEVFGADIK